MRRLLPLASFVALLLFAAACSDTPEDGPGEGTADVAEQDGAATDGAVSGDGASGDDASDDTSGPATCPPGLSGCVQGDRVVCNKAGTAFEIVACATGQLCVDGDCKECGSDSDCAKGEVCGEAGTCAAPPLSITTDALPTALVGQAYSVQLAAQGGLPPYTWKLDQGLLPDGILVSSDGELKGAPKAKGVASVAIAVTDDQGKSASKIFVVEVKAGGLVIVTSSPLPKATEGKSYAVQLEAKGGQAPYFWGIKAGTLPKGLGLGADGKITGTPTEDGTFKLDIKVLDDATPTLSATESFELPVGLAPLEIVGKQQVNLFVTKVIVLPLIVVVKDIPVPYSTQLEAVGGKKPYTWEEVPLPGAVKSFVPNSGLPKGLKLGKDGKLSGSVTDPKAVVEVKIPLTQISLKGFFFAAKVTDSQSKAKSKTAMFIVPTAPVGL